jgi:DNA-binding transcriptional MerR regulator
MDQLYTIEDLAEASGITARTIRYYTTEGLIPPPDARGRYALYSNEHLHRLYLIVRLKNAYLPLHAIKDQMENLTYAEVATLLEIKNAPEPTPGEAETTPQDEQADLRLMENSPSAFLARVLTNRKSLNARRQVGRPLNSTRERVSLNEPVVRETIGGTEWARLEVLPGVELHVTLPASTEVQAFVRKVQNAARRFSNKMSDE